jgi:hypothetical protein
MVIKEGYSSYKWILYSHFPKEETEVSSDHIIYPRAQLIIKRIRGSNPG